MNLTSSALVGLYHRKLMETSNTFSFKSFQPPYLAGVFSTLLRRQSSSRICPFNFGGSKNCQRPRNLEHKKHLFLRFKNPKRKNKSQWKPFPSSHFKWFGEFCWLLWFFWFDHRRKRTTMNLTFVFQVPPEVWCVFCLCVLGPNTCWYCHTVFGSLLWWLNDFAKAITSFRPGIIW